MRSNKYDIVVVSPRNFFLYTPLLPAVATGTMEERSIVEPVRNLVLGKVRTPTSLAVWGCAAGTAACHHQGTQLAVHWLVGLLGG